jgi:transcriptional regulator with XRE-family HTH domain
MALKLYRISAGLSRKALGEKIGRSEAFIQTLENGRKKGVLSDIDLFRLAKALGVHRNDLVAP